MVSHSTTFPAGLINALRAASHIAVLTGSGISAESGVPTFRDAQTGLWARYDPMELATSQAFRRNPRLVWDWYAWRRELIARAKPNAAHLALVEMENIARRFTLITQNVDGLHQRAGSQSVIELHGNIWRSKCSQESTVFSTWDEDGEKPPTCPGCGGLLRPDVVWFGENLPAESLSTAIQAAQNCDLFLTIGTSGLVQPAASLPVIALESGATVVEVNPERTPLTSLVTYALCGPAGEILPALVRSAWGER